MANEIDKIINGQPFREDQFMRDEDDRIDNSDTSKDERRGFRSNPEGFLDGEFGGSVFPVKIVKINNNIQKQYFSFDTTEGAINNDYYLIKKIGVKKVEVYDHEETLLETIINDNGNITIN